MVKYATHRKNSSRSGGQKKTQQKSRARSQQARKQNRNKDGTFAKGYVKNASAKKGTVSYAKSNKAKRQNRNSDGTFAKGYVGAPSSKKGNGPSGKVPKQGAKQNANKGVKQGGAKKPNTVSRGTPRASRAVVIDPRDEFTPKMKLVETVFDFSDCSRETQIKFLEVVSASFSADEIKAFGRQGRVIVTDRWTLSDTLKGGYERKTDYSEGPPKIMLQKGADDATIVHEVTHHSRTVDPSRKGFAVTAYPVDRNGVANTLLKDKYQDEITKMEETATIAETEVRTAEPSKGVNIHWGKDEIDRRDTRKADRKTMRKTEGGESIPDGKAITGTRAIEMADRNYPNTIVSNQRMENNKIIHNGWIPKTVLNMYKRVLSWRDKGKW